MTEQSENGPDVEDQPRSQEGTDEYRDTVESVIVHLVEFARTARRIVDRGEDAYFDPSDDILRRAGRSVIIDVSAAVDRLPAAVHDAYPDIPWRAIRATRNVLAHADDRVNERFVWEALRTDVVELVERLTASRDDAPSSGSELLRLRVPRRGTTGEASVDE